MTDEDFGSGVLWFRCLLALSVFGVSMATAVYRWGCGAVFPVLLGWVCGAVFVDAADRIKESRHV